MQTHMYVYIYVYMKIRVFQLQASGFDVKGSGFVRLVV